MPMRARSFGRSVLGSFTEMPATVTAPSWNGSSPLTHLISVDLPEPDGPHTTTTSPLATSVEQSFSTWKSWYHLLTWRRVIMEHLIGISCSGISAPAPAVRLSTDVGIVGE